MSQGRDRRSAVVHGGLALGTIMLVVIAVTLTGAAAAAAATTEFSSSFEAGDRPLDWTSTAEVDAQGNKKMSGVTGSARSGIPGSISDKITAVTASADNPPNETKERAFDGSVSTKWLVFENTGWLQAALSEPVAVVDYALTSANDAPERDPKDWTLQGSQDGQSWTTLDTQTGQDFSDRFQTREYRFANTTAYGFYRLDITANHGDGLIQLAELQLSNGDTTPPPPSDMKADVSSGPVNGPNMLPNAGFTGMKALQYSGEHTADGHGYAYDKVYDVDVAVTKDTELSYEIFPELTKQDLAYPSTYAAVDLAFSDGTYLSDLHAVDQHGAELSPKGQGASKTLYADQWNHQLSRIGDVAAGKTIKRILIGYDNPSGPALFNGWVDDIAIAGHPAHPARSHLSDWAITTRGTNSSGSFSRGNNFPATAVPHGFNFWTPETDAGSKSWLYEYQHANNADNLPTLQAFGLSHEPSPWMGDRQTFQVMPSTASGTPDADRAARALPFRHDNEVARPYYYGVTFENGLKGEIAPTDHAALLRFSFPGDDASLVFDNVDEHSDVTIDQQAGTIGGWTDTNSGAGATRMFIYATFDKPMTASGMLADGNRPGTGYARFDTSKGRVLTMRVATSLISLAQAKHNLALEVGQRDTFDTVKARAQHAWDEKLGVVEVQGATDDQRTTLYSSLYRLNLYPNSAFENTGTNAHPVFQHAVQSTAGAPPPSTPTQTGAPVKPGKVYVNNGFWDTYRTAWPAYSLLYPKDAGEMVDGFVQQYRDGGWVARWSSPGYANLMTGTSSDVAFADAYVKGVKGFDAGDAYDAALKNATVAPPGSNPFDTDVGRKGLIQSIFLGYTPNEVPEGLSWGLEGYINDYGIGNMAAALGDHARSATDRQRYREESTYFLSRAQGYVRLFDKRVGFFQGKSASGQWTTPPDQFDPRVWRQGGDYTETDGWNFAFHAPQDGRGLADLYGGRSQLAAKLDQFFATPETAKFPGTYGGTIHEMLEARDVRLGQWGASNQISHHIPYMYDFTGQPSKGQAIIREALRRLFVGSEIGQGYPGDEDNGEMSAWYVFSALGLYPLQVGSPNYAIGSPLFTRAVIHRQGGGDIVVNAPQNSAGNVYVRSLRVNGRDWNKTYVSQDDLARGARLDFGMGSQPSSWGTAASAAPPSLTKGADAPFPLTDAANPADGDPSAIGGTDASGLFDDTSKTQVTLSGTGRWAQFDLDRPRHVTFYTLTSGHDDGADPSGWVVKGSDDGHHWRVLDVRSGERFQWRSQTRPFALRHAGDFTRYRIEFTHPGAGRTTLSEIEFLSDRPIPPSPLAATATGGVGRAGDTVAVHVTITNSGTTPASGQLTLAVPSGWTQPAAAAFGPVAPGESKTVDVGVSVPAGTAADSYTVRATARAAQGTARATTTIQVIGDTIEFTPGTDAEKPWLVDPDGSQLDGAIHDGNGRFADNGAHFTYRFDIPAGVTGGKLTLEIGNEYLVSVSSDDQTYREVLRETNEEHDLNNLAPPHELDLNTLLGGSRTLYVRIGDSFPQDGWGGWLGHLELELTRN